MEQENLLDAGLLEAGPPQEQPQLLNQVPAVPPQVNPFDLVQMPLPAPPVSLLNRFKAEDSLPVVDTHYSQDLTIIPAVSFCHNWVLNRFDVHSLTKTAGQAIKSSPIGNADFEFQISIYPKAHTPEHNGFISVEYQLLKSKFNVTSFRAYSYLRSIAGYRYCESRSPNVFSLQVQETVTIPRAANEVFLRDQVERLLPKETLTWVFHLTVYSPELTHAKSPRELRLFGTPKEPATTLSSDLLVYVASEQLADVEITVKDHTIPAHKLILAARSPVFRAQFLHNPKVSTIEMKDTTFAAANLFVQFLYTDRCHIDKDGVGALLDLACRYLVPTLKWQCEKFLVDEMTCLTVCQSFLLSDSYDSITLFQAAVDITKINKARVLQSCEWASLKKTAPVLANKVLTELLNETYNQGFGQLDPTSPPLGSGQTASNVWLYKPSSSLKRQTASSSPHSKAPKHV